jgi:hypothetical protein
MLFGVEPIKDAPPFPYPLKNVIFYNNLWYLLMVVHFGWSGERDCGAEENRR